MKRTITGIAGVVVAGAVLLLIEVACQIEKPVENSARLQESIRYFQDARTGLCFASIGSTTANSYVSISITNVPCSDKVLALVGK